MLQAKNIYKSFASAHGSVPVLNDVSLQVQAGEFVSIVGRSGSGKTTLLNVLSTLLTPDAGELLYGDRNLAELSHSQRDQLRREHFAMIFQFHHLLPYMNALENTVLPFMNGVTPVPRSVLDRARECLARVGLQGKENRLPAKLSGGEQQRVAIARALTAGTQVLFADEPTGNLDKSTGRSVMELLQELHDEGLTIVMVTHDETFAACAERVLEMEDGSMLQQ